MGPTSEVLVSRSPSAPLALAGGLLLASLVPAVSFFTDSRPFSEIAGGGVHLALYSLTLAAVLALLVAVPRLGALRAADGRRLPEPVLAAALVATALYGATQYVQVFVATFLSETAPAALDVSGGMLMAGMVGSWVVFLVAWVVLGAVALVRRVLPRPTAILLIAGAVAQPVVGPLAALPLGMALVLAARSAATARRDEPSGELVAA
ncbi:UNVERIFIED_ORG: hypothetical protein E4P37_07020 [Bacillus sp. AZ43]